MKDFKSYSQNTRSAASTAGAAGTASAAGNTNNRNNTNGKSSGGTGSVEQTVNMAAMLAKAFDGKSEGQIWQTILAQAEQGKRDGTLTNADLDNFYNTVAPMLDGFRRQKLKSVISKLKAI